MVPGYCYILYSAKLDKYYVGSTPDAQRRLRDHNRGKEKFTRTGIPWTLMHTEQFEALAEARQREKYIKRMKSRKFIEALIAQQSSASRFQSGGSQV